MLGLQDRTMSGGHGAEGDGQGVPSVLLFLLPVQERAADWRAAVPRPG